MASYDSCGLFMFDLDVLPLTYVPTVFNRLKIPAVVTLILGVSNVLLPMD